MGGQRGVWCCHSQIGWAAHHHAGGFREPLFEKSYPLGQFLGTGGGMGPPTGSSISAACQPVPITLGHLVLRRVIRRTDSGGTSHDPAARAATGPSGDVWCKHQTQFLSSKGTARTYWQLHYIEYLSPGRVELLVNSTKWLTVMLPLVSSIPSICCSSYVEGALAFHVDARVPEGEYRQ